MVGFYKSVIQSMVLISDSSIDELDLSSDGKLSGASFVVDVALLVFSFVVRYLQVSFAQE